MMLSMDLFDGTAFGFHKDAPAKRRIGPLILLDQLPACACGNPADDPFLRFIFALIDGGFCGVRLLEKDEPDTETCWLLADSIPSDATPFWISVDPVSIEGQVLFVLLLEIRNGTSRTDRDLAAHAMHVVEMAYNKAGRASEFHAAGLRILEKQHAAGVL